MPMLGPIYPDAMTTRFIDGTFDRIDDIAGSRKRAAFIREAVDEKIERALAQRIEREKQPKRNRT
jgi:hypothetical protein